MNGALLFGVIATAVALVVFLAWTYHELRRVDQFAPPEDDGSGQRR